MIGETNKGFCLRESLLYYGDDKTNEQACCTIPLTDGKPCGDTKLSGPRCPYNKNPALTMDLTDVVFITYPQANGKTKK